jgi:gas vesicle protein
VFGRRQVKTHSQLMRDELSEGFGHLWQAAAHAAGGVGATVGPKWDSAKGHLPHRAGTMRDVAAQGLDSTMAAFAPLMEAARTGAMNATRKAQKAGRKARKRESGMARKRTAILVGLLTGAAAGAAGAIIARRRNRAKWEEYEAQGIDAARGYAKSALDTARTATDQGAQRVGDAAEQTRQGVSNVAGRTGDALEQGKEKTDQFAEKAHTISKNNRN